MIITLQTLIFFRESLLNAIDRLLRPYYNKLSLAFGRHGETSDDEESDEQVFAEYDPERGVVFYPPMYLQRYAAVSDCLMEDQWCGKLEKVVDLGYHDMSFINYLKEVQGVKCILGVDLESIPLRCSIDLAGCDEYVPKRENPLEVTLFKGNAADPDYRLIGCDAVIAIEMIEHMLPHDLDRLIHTVFGFIKPWVAIFTTPNGDFNVLFKALEKNGLRRLDHFFEWSRDQFHEWCSNIVTRYPQYTVSCKGIGPGPPDTKHLGCCSQMAVFVAKEYKKQQNLNLNSLALVAESPSPHSISNLISSWETPDIPNESNMIEPARNTESYPELRSEMQSSITLMLSTPSSSLEAILYQDKTSQCNLESENNKGYLMFDYEQMCFDVLKPRRNMGHHRVYHIEDVYNRLSCSTMEVKRFSKTTLNLMAKNKLDALVHTREVVDEIRHLTKLLNFNKQMNNQLENGTHTWYNINWGDNAPYWNQYYKIVKAYNYPFEIKSDECRILDLISDEINRLIDSQLDEDGSFEVNKLEIPLELLMRVVEHITDDVDKVKDLLEWNGYEIVGDFVIHSRIVLDYSSTGTQEEDSLDTTDVYSDWDSTSLSDGSTTVPDYHVLQAHSHPLARCLRRAVDQKVRRLRSMLTADEDITTELDRVVCRLMKLALRTSKGRNTPPPSRWMQCKLLDLLTLTEKTIERRKRHFIENYPLKVIDYEEKSQEMIALEKIKEDNTALRIVDKYQHLVNQSENMDAQYRYLDFDLEDLSGASTDFAKNSEFVDGRADSPNVILEPCIQMFQSEDAPQEDSKLQRTQAWVEEDIEVVPYPIHDGNFDNSSIEMDRNASKFSNYYKKKFKGKQCIELNCVIRKKSHSKYYKHRSENKTKDNSKTKLEKKPSRKRPNNYVSGVQTAHSKMVSVDCRACGVKPRKRQHKNPSPTAAKPIPVSLIELCHPQMTLRHNSGAFNVTNKNNQDKMLHKKKTEIAATKKNMFIEIITESTTETIALQRTVGTDADVVSSVLEEETLIRSVSNTLLNDDMFDKHNIATENVHSQTIFLYDLDEPTTSKGIRHVGMDVQCGPDTSVPVYAMLSATTSSTRVPKMFMAGIKIGDSATDTKVTNTDFGICTHDCSDSYKTIIPTNRSHGIKIKDSDTIILENRINCSTVSTYSAGSSTPSLVRLPNIVTLGINAVDSKTDNIKTGTDFEATTNISEQNNSENYLQTEKTKTITNSMSKISLTLGSLTDIDKLPDHDSGLSKVTTIFDSVQDNDENKNPDHNVMMNMQRSINTQESYDKLVVSSQQSTKTSETFTEPRPRFIFNDFRSLLSNRIERPLRSQNANDKSYLLTRRPSKKQVSPKGVQKKSVDFQLQSPVSRIPKRQKLSSVVKSHDKPLILRQKMASSTIVADPILINKDKPPDVISHFGSEIQIEPEYFSNTNVDVSRSCTSSPIQLLKLNNFKISKLEDISIMADSEDFNSSSVNMNIPVEIPTNDICNVTEKSKNANLWKSSQDLEVNDLSPVVSQSVLKTCQISVHNSLSINDQVMTKVVSNSMRRTIRSAKKKLCSGGIQVHSYRDKQSFSEDIMYQGQWQENKPKVLARKKGCIPVFSRKFDTYLKKKVNSSELLKSSRASFSEKRNKNTETKNNFKFNLIPPVLPRNSKKQTNLKEKHNSLPNTACVATIAKPFRNILKVPSKFPISKLPSMNIKSLPNNFNVTRHPTIPIIPVKKEDKLPQKGVRKNYIPQYLKLRALNVTNKASKTDLNLSFDLATTKIKKNKENIPKPLARAKTEEIKHDLLKFRSKPLTPQYVVFRNEVEQKKSDGQQRKPTSENVKRKDACRQRSSTPTSANSSTCSSPCSIATVRAVPTRTKNVSNRRHSTPSHNIPNSGSENSTPDRNRKFTKRCKTARVTVENKENIPETSKINVGNKEISKHGKGILMGHKNDIYISHVKDSFHSSVNIPPKNKYQKSNIPTAKSFSDKKLSPHQSQLSNKASIMLEDVSLSASRVHEISECAQTSNMVLIIEPQPRTLYTPEPTAQSKLDDTNVVNHSLVYENIDNIDKGLIDGQHNNIHSTIKEMLEESLDFIKAPIIEESVDSDTALRSESVYPDTDSPATSFKTIVTSDDNEILPSDIEFALNRSFDVTLGHESTLSLNDTNVTVTDLDCFSFKSMTSGSRLSGYMSADTEFSSSIKMPKCTISSSNSTSVREIFERKEQPLQPAQNQNTSGSLANQAFSGFTINEDSIVGDGTDLINIIDSETGSLLAVAIPRQATSEELLISGRSSESFESCVLDDETVVPNWLFQLINQQASSLNEVEPPAELGSLPSSEPMFDDNANVVEAPGAGAGAGDGRGIHSDHSQDSSGRGTSVSSSETSLGPQSEMVLLEPGSFAAQFELLRDAVESSVVLAINNPEGSVNASGSRQVPNIPVSEPQSYSGGESRRTPRVDLMSASDADADVSSLGTDAPDSDVTSD